ncbi:hypothetical protein DFH08DRAFT_974977 [Mycena albidolilacea]|uniref:Uncharacterized protein n=1 Tax=Mycena albidolilacea TaxID=1033008 RepID=A0AAD6Z657_9AGAR|nr:hypothetical protein DFH08DRAFT_974977 [Mycena albidolilacea]
MSGGVYTGGARSRVRLDSSRVEVRTYSSFLASTSHLPAGRIPIGVHLCSRSYRAGSPPADSALSSCSFLLFLSLVVGSRLRCHGISFFGPTHPSRNWDGRGLHLCVVLARTLKMGIARRACTHAEFLPEKHPRCEHRAPTLSCRRRRWIPTRRAEPGTGRGQQDDLDAEASCPIRGT